jgi:WD40 repeat protein
LTASSGDGRIAATVFGGKTVSCRETKSGRLLCRYDSESPLLALALSAQGRSLAAASEAGIVEIRSLETGRRVVLSIGAAARMNPDLNLAFSPDGTLLATSEWDVSGEANPVAIWNVETGERLKEYPGNRARASDLLFSADGQSLIIASGPTIRRWFLEENSDRLALAGHKDEAWSVAFSPEGGIMASGSDDNDRESIKLWDPASGQLIRGWHGGAGTTAALEFSPDGSILASAHLTKEDNVRLWDVATGRLLATLKGHTARARTVAFHPDGKLLASGGSDKTVRLWDVEHQKSLGSWTGHEESIQRLAFSPDGTQLASAATDGTVRLWDVAQGQTRYKLSGPENFTAVEFSPDGRMLAGSGESGSITLWDAADGTQIALLRDEVRVLRTLAFTPDSQILAAAGETGPIRLWDVLTAQPLHSLPESSGHIHSLAFAPDGSALAYSRHDGVVSICGTGNARRHALRGAAELPNDQAGRPSRRKPPAEPRAQKIAPIQRGSQAQ